MSKHQVTFDFTPADLVECDRISDRLRGANNVAEVDLIASEERAWVVDMLSKDKSAPLGQAVSNLKIYTLYCLKHERK